MKKRDKLNFNRFVNYHSIHIIVSSATEVPKYIIIDNKQVEGRLHTEIRVVIRDPNSEADKDVEYKGDSFKDAVKVYNSTPGKIYTNTR